MPEMRFACGCDIVAQSQEQTPVIITSDKIGRWIQCPLHAAARDLLKACEAAEAVLTKVVPLDGNPDWIDGQLLPSIRAAIAKAKPKE